MKHRLFTVREVRDFFEFAHLHRDWGDLIDRKPWFDETATRMGELIERAHNETPHANKKVILLLNWALGEDVTTQILHIHLQPLLSSRTTILNLGAMAERASEDRYVNVQPYILLCMNEISTVASMLHENEVNNTLIQDLELPNDMLKALEELAPDQNFKGDMT